MMKMLMTLKRRKNFKLQRNELRNQTSKNWNDSHDDEKYGEKNRNIKFKVSTKTI